MFEQLPCIKLICINLCSMIIEVFQKLHSAQIKESNGKFRVHVYNTSLLYTLLTLIFERYTV